MQMHLYDLLAFTVFAICYDSQLEFGIQIDFTELY